MDGSSSSLPFKFPHVNVAGQHMTQSTQQSQPQGTSYSGQFRSPEAQDQAVRPAGVKIELQPSIHSNVQYHSPKPGGTPVGPSPSASGGGLKRSRNRPPSRASGTSASSNVGVASQFKSMELTPAPWRKKPKVLEKQIPDDVAAMIPQSVLFDRLLEFEDRIDTVLKRKKAEIQESINHPPRIRKTLRLYVFNTFENQGLEVHERKESDPPSWSLKIIGRILEDGKDPLLSGLPQKLYPEFSSFLKKITVYLDQSLFPNNHVVLWENVRSPVLHEGLEVNRKGDKEFTARIRLEMNNTPEKFKLSTALSEILGIDAETRSKILVAIWQYIKSKKLQIAGDPSYFSCDTCLQKIFGEDKIKFSSVPQKINPHLTTLPPIHLEHRIKLSGAQPIGTTCYDIAVDVPVNLQKDLTAFLSSTKRKEEADAFDEVIRETLKKLRECQRRRAFFSGFSESPAVFINTLIASQTKDLKLASGDASQNIEKEHKSDFYNQTWVEDAVSRYLNRKSAGIDTTVS